MSTLDSSESVLSPNREMHLQFPIRCQGFSEVAIRPASGLQLVCRRPEKRKGTIGVSRRPHRMIQPKL